MRSSLVTLLCVFVVGPWFIGEVLTGHIAVCVCVVGPWFIGEVLTGHIAVSVCLL